MNTQQPTNGRNPSHKLRCPHCNTQLLPLAVFCSSCGERVKNSGDWERRAENAEDKAQEQNGDTVRVAWLSQKRASSLLETEMPRTDLADTRAQREASIPIELSQPLPTTPVPTLSETWQQIPETEVPALKPPGSNQLWPLIIILSAVAAGLVNFVFTDIAIRPLIVFWFLIVCPGMVLIRFLRLKEPVVEWTLAIALSFAIDALVAGIQLYAGKWSPAVTLSILIGLSIGSAIIQLAPIGSITIFMLKQLRILH